MGIATVPPNYSSLAGKPPLPTDTLFLAQRYVSAVATPHNSLIPYDFTAQLENFRLSFEVLNTLEKYGRHIRLVSTGDLSSFEVLDTSWPGKSRFLPHVYHFVKQRQPVQLTMPAFPCKSSNRENKVLSHLPDFGEELALRRLNSLGEDIRKVYAPGARVLIATDGVLFNDILDISDADCWDYGEELKAMIADLGLNNLSLTRPMNLLGLLPEEITNKETYLATVEICRVELERRFASSEEAISTAILQDEDTRATYLGMTKFLQSEMELALSGKYAGLSNNSKRKLVKVNARKMMQRSEAFTLAIRTLRPLDVRLSMHPSSGSSKLSFPLIPTSEGNFQKSPWHSCVVVEPCGGYRAVHRGEVKNTHDLVFRNGKPWYFCRRPSLNFGDELRRLNSYSVDGRIQF